MNQKTMTLKVDTGSVLINIDDKGEIIGSFRFNPNDLDILNRYNHVVSVLENISVPEDYSQEDFFKITDKIKEQFDYLLNYNVSDEIFKKCNPLTLTESGDFYAENVIEGVTGLIESITNERIKKKKAKINKATAKYHK